MVKITPEGRKNYPSNVACAEDFGQCLKGELSYLSNTGYASTIIDESPIVWAARIGKDSAEILQAEQRILSDLQKSSRIPLIVHFFNGDILHKPKKSSETILEAILSSKVAGVGIDLINSSTEKVCEHNLGGKTIFAGLINAQGYSRQKNGSVVLEDPKSIKESLLAIKDAGAGQITLVPNTRMEFVPRSVADQKIQLINKVIGGF
jgi:methionine synthase II (cobalamin-independent)